MKVAVNRLVKLSAIQFSFQQSAAVVSPQNICCQWSKTQKSIWAVHACCRAQSLHAALMDYSAAGWTGVKSQDALSLLGKCPCCGCHDYDGGGISRVEQSQWPWKAPQGAGKLSWAGGEMSVLDHPDSEIYAHLSGHQQYTNIHAIYLYVCMLVLIHLLTESLFLLNLPWCICPSLYSQAVTAGREGTDQVSCILITE